MSEPGRVVTHSLTFTSFPVFDVPIFLAPVGRYCKPHATSVSAPLDLELNHKKLQSVLRLGVEKSLISWGESGLHLIHRVLDNFQQGVRAGDCADFQLVEQLDHEPWLQHTRLQGWTSHSYCAGVWWRKSYLRSACMSSGCGYAD